MNSNHDKKRMNVEGDRLSNLPDDLIHKILSFISLKHAIGTSALSSRWRSIWTSMPYLSFSSEDFTTLPKFSKFVTKVLSRRNGRIELFSVNLRFRGKVIPASVKKIMNYAFFHNVQEMSVTCLLENDIEFPLSFFSSQSLKHLTFTKELAVFSYILKATSTWDLPALTTLHLHGVDLCCYDTDDKCTGLFSKCANLKNLSLKECRMTGFNGFSVCHPTLSDLILTLAIRTDYVNVVAPHLHNLSITNLYRKCEYLISTPNLASLVYKGGMSWELNTDGFHSLEKADLCVTSSYADARDKACLIHVLQQLQNVQILRLSQEVVEVLSSSVETISYQPSPFVNLKSLIIYPKRELFERKLTMSTELKSYLLDSSPSATLTIVLREEITAKKLMSELRVLLEQENIFTEINKPYMEQGKALMEGHNAKMLEQQKAQPDTMKPLQFGGRMWKIKSCWENLRVQLEQRIAKACLIISKLQRIEELLTVLPASRRAMIQPCFSSLCAEADFFSSKITESVKMQCDENQSRVSVCFHELATTMDQPS